MPKAHAVTRREFARTCACAARGRVIALSVSMSVCLFVCGQRSLGKIGTLAQPFITMYKLQMNEKLFIPKSYEKRVVHSVHIIEQNHTLISILFTVTLACDIHKAKSTHRTLMQTAHGVRR